MQTDEPTNASARASSEFFRFERREVIAFAALALILAVGCGALWLAPAPAELRIVQLPRGSQLPGGSQLPYQFVSAASPRVVNLNTATREELISLPGIGPKKAQAILDDRAERGRFASVDALDRVKGIGPATVQRLRPLVSVADEARPPSAPRTPTGDTQ